MPLKKVRIGSKAKAIYPIHYIYIYIYKLEYFDTQPSCKYQTQSQHLNIISFF